MKDREGIDMKTDPKITMKSAILTIGIVCAIIGILYMVQAFRYPIGVMGRPGPGAFPIFAGSILLIGAIGAVVQTIVKPPEDQIEWPKGKESLRVGMVAAASLIYAVGLEYLGYIPATAIVTIAGLHAMGLRSWPLKLVIAAVMAFGSFLFFATVLGVPLPGGVIQLWLQGG
jgi:putative tricarboxylic transport membrane protein